jgi:hypothetical protein
MTMYTPFGLNSLCADFANRSQLVRDISSAWKIQRTDERCISRLGSHPGLLVAGFADLETGQIVKFKIVRLPGKYVAEDL